MIPAGELAAMQAEAARTLPDLCDIREASRVFDDGGGWTDTYATVATVPCRVRPSAQVVAAEQRMADRLQGRTAFVVTLPAVLPGGVVLDGARRLQRHGDPDELEVIDVGAPESWPVSTRLLCARVR